MIITVSQTTGYTVALSATANTGVVSWFRVADAGDVYLGDGTDLVDVTVPLNTPTVYYATDDVDTEIAAPITVTSTLPVLTSTVYGTWMQVVVQAQSGLQFEARSVVFDILNTPEPVVAWAPAAYPTGSYTIRCETRSQRQQLLTLLQQGDPLRMRSTLPDRADTLTFLPTSWTDPNDQDVPGAARLVEIEFKATDPAPTAGPDVVPVSYADLLAVGTYADVDATYASYLAVLASGTAAARTPLR